MDLATIPKDDAATFAAMTRADTIGVFQIESRAQMATLPRMQPRCFYDVAIEVAIIRPGPIQGNMVHPYLARRAGKEKPTYFDAPELLKPVLERTLGVPLFQEQLLKIAMVMADFSGSEAEELRRALSFHRSPERMEKVEVKLRAAMTRKGISAAVIEDIVKATKSFALYGFPESHAMSFALLAYGSAWLKVHRAPEFFASLLNNQPMGFYSSATLVRGRAPARGQNPARVRAAFRMGLHGRSARRRRPAGFVRGQRAEPRPRRSPLGNPPRAGLPLAAGFPGPRRARPRRTPHAGGSRRVERLRRPPARRALGSGHARSRANRTSSTRRPRRKPADSPLAPMDPGERLQADYDGMNLTTGPHAMALLRPHLPPDVWRAADLARAADGQRVRIAGNVICRQRPGTARGFVFVSLEDETGIANAIVAPDLFEKLRLTISQEAYLLIEGRVQMAEGTIHVKAAHIEGLANGGQAHAGSHDFH